MAGHSFGPGVALPCTCPTCLSLLRLGETLLSPDRSAIFKEEWLQRLRNFVSDLQDCAAVDKKGPEVSSASPAPPGEAGTEDCEIRGKSIPSGIEPPVVEGGKEEEKVEESCRKAEESPEVKYKEKKKVKDKDRDREPKRSKEKRESAKEKKDKKKKKSKPEEPLRSITPLLSREYSPGTRESRRKEEVEPTGPSSSSRVPIPVERKPSKSLSPIPRKSSRSRREKRSRSPTPLSRREKRSSSPPPLSRPSLPRASQPISPKSRLGTPPQFSHHKRDYREEYTRDSAWDREDYAFFDQHGNWLYGKNRGWKKALRLQEIRRAGGLEAWHASKGSSRR